MAITAGRTNMSNRQAALFISHGAPTLPIEDSPTRHFLTQLGQTMPRPRAIIVVSAHWESTMPMVNLAAKPETMYDFGGFPPFCTRCATPPALI
jgi:4,5-DOPA dioxygenase extradiol